MLINPLHHVLRAYDRAIIACDRRDYVAAYRGIALLRASLELDSPQAIGFDGIFAWCEQAVSDGDFEGSAGHLRKLRDAWALVDVLPPSHWSGIAEPRVLAFETTANRRARS